MIVVEPRQLLEIVLQQDKSLCIRQSSLDGKDIQIKIPADHVLHFENCIIRLLETYND